jgi:demethylspheroidene O-methyltransferase
MWREWRNRLLMSARFQRAAAAFPLTRRRARREARELFDIVAGFTYSQITLACVRLGLLQRLRDAPATEDDLLTQLAMPPAAAATLRRSSCWSPARCGGRRAGRSVGVAPRCSAIPGCSR